MHTPKVGLDESVKEQLQVMQKILDGERICIGGDLKGHVWRSSKGYESVQYGQGLEIGTRLEIQIQ